MTFDLKNPQGILVGIVVAVVAVSMLAAVLPTLIGFTINLSLIADMPLASLFAAGGAVLFLIGAAVVFAYIKLFGAGKKR